MFTISNQNKLSYTPKVPTTLSRTYCTKVRKISPIRPIRMLTTMLRMVSEHYFWVRRLLIRALMKIGMPNLSKHCWLLKIEKNRFQLLMLKLNKALSSLAQQPSKIDYKTKSISQSNSPKKLALRFGC